MSKKGKRDPISRELDRIIQGMEREVEQAKKCTKEPEKRVKRNPVQGPPATSESLGQVETVFAGKHILIPSEESKARDVLARRDFLTETLLSKTEKMGVVGEENNKMLFAIAGISRLDQTPLHVLSVSRAGTGKSFTQKSILNLFPESEVLRLSRTTPQVLYYMRESLSGKIISIDEVSGALDSMYSLRSLMSEYKLDLLATGIDLTGNYSAQRRQIEARSSVFLSTTDMSSIDAETRSRMVCVHGDETPDQTKRIKEALIFLNGTQAGAERRREFSKIVKALRDQLHLIRGIKVLFKDEEAMKSAISENHSLSERRNYSGFLTVIRNIARSRMFQRRIEVVGGEETIFVHKDDVELARKLSGEIVSFQYRDLSGALLTFYQEIERHVREKWKTLNDETNVLNPLARVTFTAREIREKFQWGHTSTHNYLTALVRLDYLSKTGRNGELVRYHLAAER